MGENGISRRGAEARRVAQGGWASRPPLLGGVVRWQAGGFRYGGFLAAWGLGVRFFWGFGPANDGRSPRMGKNGISRRGAEARRGEEIGRLRVPANDANPREWKTRVGSDRRADPKFRRAAPPGGKKDSHRDTERRAESSGILIKNFEGGVIWQPHSVRKPFRLPLRQPSAVATRFRLSGFLLPISGFASTSIPRRRGGAGGRWRRFRVRARG